MKSFLKNIMREIWMARGKEKGQKKGMDIKLNLTSGEKQFARWLGG
jgi:hypothetical protein